MSFYGPTETETATPLATPRTRRSKSPEGLVTPSSSFNGGASLSTEQFTESVPTKLYVGALSYETTVDQLYEIFGEYGTVQDAFIPQQRDEETGESSSRGFGFVTLGSMEEAEAAIRVMDGQPVDGRYIKVNVAQPKPPREAGQYGPGAVAPMNGGGGPKLFVGGISPSTTVDSLTSLFTNKVGAVVDCYIPSDRETGYQKSFAFVTMRSSEDAQSAINTLNGEDVGEGYSLRINYANNNNGVAATAGGDGGRTELQ
jgi:nucleolin